MSGLDSLYVPPELEAQAANRPQADARAAPTWLQAADANLELGQDRSGYNRAIAFSDAYNNLENALDEEARKRINAEWSRYGIRDPKTGITRPKTPEERQRLVWAEVERARRDGKSFAGIAASKEEYDGAIYTGLKQNRARNKDVAAREDGWTAGVVGGMAGALSDPVNAGSLAISGPAGLGAKALISGFFINAGTELATIPLANQELALLGDSETAGQQAANVVMAGALGVAFPVAIKVGGKSIDLGLKGAKIVGGKIVDAAGNLVPLDKRIAKALGKANIDQVSDRDIAEIFAQVVPAEYRTPAQADALTILERQGQLQAVNPYRDTYADIDAHLQRADAALARVSTGIVQGRAPAAPVRQSSAASVSFDMGSYLQRNRRAESGGNDAAAAGTSSAYGRYQFLKGTWLNYYKQVFGETGESDTAILRKRADGAVQDRLMAAFTQDNIKTLRNAGVQPSQGNAYLAHFLGPADAVKVLRADPATPIAQLVRAASISANEPVFRNVRTAGDLTAWAARKMGGKVTDVPAGGPLSGLPDGEEIPFVRPAALDAVRPVVTAEGKPVALQAFKPADIEVDANLMQFKSGGDAQGVTERLRGVQQWDPIAAGAVTVWESLDGRRLIADGHQRLGLAKRMLAANPDADISLNAFVLREADGITARDARIITALKNIGEGSGTLTDAAKVFREGGDMAAEALAKRLPPRSVLVRDGKALASLSDEAFGAVVNEVVPDSWGAVIGSLAPDPDTHMAMIELLAKLNPPNRKQAEGIVRQALAAGFSRETQEELFGAREFSVALFAQKARAVERTLAELRKLKGVFSTAARNAQTLEGAGNRIDAVASAAEAADNADALAIVEKLAYVTGDVSEIFNRAAQRLADGEPAARVIADTVAEIRKLELSDIINSDRAAGGSGDGAFGSGRGGLFDRQDEQAFGDPFGPDDVNRDPGGLTPEERATLEYEEPGLGLFDDPVGEGPRLQADGLRHDLKAALTEAAPPAPAAAAATDIMAGQLGKRVDELVDMAAGNQVELLRIAGEVSQGGRVVDGGTKARERILQKVADEGYGEPGELKDLARISIVIDNPAQADAIATGFGERLGVMDKGWQRTGAGYVDRKLILQFENGGVAEVQIVPGPLADYKFGDARELYKTAREAATPDAVREQALATMRERYAALLTGTEFAGIDGNAARAAAGSISDPSTSALARNAGDAGTQLPSLSSEAVDPSTAISRSSTSNNLISDTSGAAYRDELLTNQQQDGYSSIAFAARDGADETVDQVLKSVEAEEAALKALRECL